MVKLTIDHKIVEVNPGTTILQAAEQAGIKIPTLCYLNGVHEIGACRVCVVEIEGQERLAASCNTPVEDGMVIYTNTPRVRQARKTNVQLLLSEHQVQCPTCVRSGNCSLQSLANDLNLLDQPYEEKTESFDWNKDFPLIRDSAKCIKCLRCVDVCEKVQGIGVWEANGSGAHMRIDVKNGLSIDNTSCTLCGQCVTHCPVGALRERDDTAKVLRALDDPEMITVVQIAPAVRAAWGEGVGLSREEATVGRMAAAVRALGFNYVFDTDFTADLTIMEEGSEFVQGFGKGKMLMTSCCPGWVRFLIKEYPDMLPYLSSAKSPQQMFGAVAKSWYAKQLGVAPEKVFCVSIMPCTAKKYEAAVTELSARDCPDVDAVLTTRELNRLIRALHVNVHQLEDEPFDEPLGLSTGAAVIFGVTGGVMEAALRSAYYLITGKNPQPDAFTKVRGREGWREAEFDIEGAKVRVAVASGLGNARKLVEAIRSGEVSYDFVEVMACPGGCVGGGGQPILDGCEQAQIRGESLYHLDSRAPMRFSHENPAVQKLYQEYFEKPLSKKAHHELHTNQQNWTLD